FGEWLKKPHSALQLTHLEQLNINRCALSETFSVTPVLYMKR
ncbi:MAG: hypothetical protein ACI8WB_003766, partial [Phenylobacterium sp.]